jgi:hypothetical protein
MQPFNHNRYLIVSGITVAALLLFVAAFNYIVDPYNLLGNNRTGVYFCNERQAKDAILKYDHQAILIGSSKTGYINPDDLSCYRFYNASMRGMVPEEMFFYLKKYLRNEKLVLIGFDFYMFNEREFPLLNITDWNDLTYTKVEYLLGAKIVKVSWKTLKMWYKGEDLHSMKENGQFVYPGVTQMSLSDDPSRYEKRYHDIIRGLVRHYYDKFSFSKRRMDYVWKIKALLDEKNIPYAIFINPKNHDVFAALQQLETYGLFVSWQQEMKTIFPEIYDFSHSKYSAKEGFYRGDPYHYTNATGKMFLNEIIKDYCTSQSTH